MPFSEVAGVFRSLELCKGLPNRFEFDAAHLPPLIVNPEDLKIPNRLTGLVQGYLPIVVCQVGIGLPHSKPCI